MAKYAVVIAVLPFYRANFVSALQRLMVGNELSFYAGDRHLDPTVKSADVNQIAHIRLVNRALLGRRLMWQSGALAAALKADTAIVDLNPRMLSTWVVLLIRRSMRRRTLVWGHLHPRKGASASTAALRRRMRSLANGFLAYTWTDADEARLQGNEHDVWVAANGLYPSKRLHPTNAHRNRFIYVGRLEAAKKPGLMIEAFASLLVDPAVETLGQNLQLDIFGDGAETDRLKRRAADLGVGDRVIFHGLVTDLDTLERAYGSSICALSPGYAGLSVTQSLGFGVPILVADKEPHAPEIELLTPTRGAYFAANDANALRQAMAKMVTDVPVWDRQRESMSAEVRAKYSADAMADGFRCALQNIHQSNNTHSTNI